MTTQYRIRIIETGEEEIIKARDIGQAKHSIIEWMRNATRTLGTFGGVPSFTITRETIEVIDINDL